MTSRFRGTANPNPKGRGKRLEEGNSNYHIMDIGTKEKACELW